MKVSKWGDGLAVRLPEELVETMGLKEGDDVSVFPVRSGTTKKKPMTDEEKGAAIERLRALRVHFPPDFKFDREEANAR